MTEKFTRTTLLLCVPALLCGPLMALMPRGMMALVIYCALILIPSIKKHFSEIVAKLDKSSFILLTCAILYTCVIKRFILRLMYFIFPYAAS
jgi:hypothetical protein